MSKASITRMWIAGLIILVAGLAVGGISLGLMLANGGTWEPAASGNGSDFIPTINGFFWTTVGFMIAGFTIAAVGGVIQLAAWIGALVNTYQLEDKAWFIILLVGGLLGLAVGLIAFAAMVAYLIAGPDGMPAGRQHAPAPVPSYAPQTPQMQQAPYGPYAPYAPQTPQTQQMPEVPVAPQEPQPTAPRPPENARLR